MYKLAHVLQHKFNNVILISWTIHDQKSWPLPNDKTVFSCI